jgi:hypothetical protein
MANLFDRLKKKGAAPAPETVTSAAPNAEDEVRGKDPRRLAEEKADRAGAKWRREAEARGVIAREIGGPKGLEPTRYGDWERAGRCIDF